MEYKIDYIGDSCISVSYTHLDVYKRQLPYCDGFVPVLSVLLIQATQFLSLGTNHVVLSPLFFAKV